jgi:hypothetical protein
MASVGVLAAAFVVAAYASIPLAGQAQTAGAKTSAAWTVPRTPDGKPDLQGMWVNFDQTPFEQPLPGAGRAMNNGENGPAAGGGRAAGGGAAAAGGGRAAGGGAAAPGGGGNAFGDKAAVVPRRPSMVVDPPNGRVPVMAWAEKLRDDKVAHIGDTWENGTTWDRCLTRGIPGGIFPAGYNNAYQIVQSPGYVAILYEMIHVTRAIPTDASPHFPANVRFWDGDSRGHWEGDTLVVDIANYNGKGDIATNMASGRIRGIPASDQLHVLERYTPVSANIIDYEVTITDPKVYTAPWKVAMPLTRDNSYQMYEYACHEGNVYFETNTLSGGRADEKKAALSGAEGSIK